LITTPHFDILSVGEHVIDLISCWCQEMSPSPPDATSPADSDSSFGDRFLRAGFDAEDLWRYEPGGYHPVYLGDVYNERYQVVHKLGHGGFSTVWLAKDQRKSSTNRWVALKIVVADESTRVKEKIEILARAVPRSTEWYDAATGHDVFTIEGPNGSHACSVLPVLGPSLSQLSNELKFRLHPKQARRAAHLATKALASLHACGICHGDATTANFVFAITDLSNFTLSDVYNTFGPPETALVASQSDEAIGPDCPRYQVKCIDFLSSSSSMIALDTLYLIDFDQSFAANSPPEELLGTPAEYLAPEIAVGEKASTASDVWCLACTIFRLRSGHTPFHEWEVSSPAAVLMVIVERLNQDLPDSWQNVKFDDEFGHPVKDGSQGGTLIKLDTERLLRDIVFNVIDQPAKQSSPEGVDHGFNEEDHQPVAPQFAHLGWNLSAVVIDGVFLDSFNEDKLELRKQLPKIPTEEAKLLYDLLRNVFAYDPAQRPSARELLNHPWFSYGS
jgi:serine/threonine protein kinase